MSVERTKLLARKARFCSSTGDQYRTKFRQNTKHDQKKLNIPKFDTKIYH